MPSKLTAARSWLVACLLLFTTVSFAQQKTVTGKVVNDKDKSPLVGATITVKGGTVATSTGADGSFTISVPSATSTLVISSVGFGTLEVELAGRDAVSIEMKEGGSTLNEIVVTGYTAQRKKDIIGAVSVVNTKDLQTTPSSSIGVQLQGRAAGVQVSSSGEPGAGAIVRIRGFASAAQNGPLYIIDGVPTTDANKFNPQDVESLQVLKDATSASIYGARAANGVVIITTRQGKLGKSTISYDAYMGTQRITDKMIPDLLNTQQYVDYLTRTQTTGYSHPVFGNYGSFSIPDFIVIGGGFKGGVAANDPRADPAKYSIENYGNIYQIMKTSPGTNWFQEMMQPGYMMSHQLSASGGTDKATYSASVNYFDQKGTFIETKYKRYTVRANSSFRPKSFFRMGENMQISFEDRVGGANRGEGDAWASAFRMVPYIPVYDIKGGYGGNGVGTSGNGSSPIANLQRASDNTNKWLRLFGNVFGEVTFAPWLTARTSFGVDYGNQYERFVTKKTYERSENVATTQLTEQSYYYFTWTWTNTLNFQKTFAEDHDVKVLVGSEAIKENPRGVGAFAQNFDFETPDFVSLNTAVAGSLGDRGVYNYNFERASLFSYFGRLDYAYQGKYLLNATVRRDGSSRFGPNVRYAVFPSIGVGWRISDEEFMKGIPWLNDLKLRAGWGQMGSQSNVRAANSFSTFTSGAGSTNYDINGGNTSTTQGYRANFQGNPDTKWETTETTNVGIDATIFNNMFEVSLDVYTKNTEDLLVEQLRNGLEGLIGKPFINLGTMQNRGVDLAITSHHTIARDFRLDATLTFTRYKNELTKLNNEGTPDIIGLERLGNAVRSDIGQPISSFHGFVLDGFYNSATDVTKGPLIQGAPAIVGTWKYKDVNGDGDITDADRTYLGSPHPDFQMGLNLNLAYKSFDFQAFFFWNQGNEIYNYTKYYTDMRVFVGGVSTRVLNDSWTPTNQNAKLPQLGATVATNGFTPFATGVSNSYYVEDGSYFRAKNIQLGYSLPKALLNNWKIENVRFYVQAVNLFTLTNYSGGDPDLNIISRDPGGRGDRYIGVDLGGFPNPKQVFFGLNVTF
ncbi:MAG: TonB-dependent receptor [Chitinophagaceae bacterium]|nr:TonB-dependent receptor [Chitinophagaceae bacterium]